MNISPAYAPFVGGAERHLQAVSERLAARGHEMTVFTINGTTLQEIVGQEGGSLPPLEVINGVTVRRFPPGAWLTRLFSRWMELPGAWRATSLLLGPEAPMYQRTPSPIGILQELRRTEVDVVTAMHWSFAPAWAGYVARRTRKFALVGVPLLHVGRPWTENTMFPRMLAACDAVLVNTRVEGAFAGERGGRNVTVAGVGIAPEMFERRDGRLIRQRLELGSDPIVGFIGRQVAAKGVLTLVEAMAEVWQAMPDARLLFAGQSAHRGPELNAELAALPPERRSRVILVDDFSETDLPHIVDACDVLVLPSIEESFGIVFLEGWMCGKPVIGARIPSTECVIEEGVDGLIAEPLDAPDLACCILALLRDPRQRERMGAAGRVKTLANYTWDAVTDRWEAAMMAAAKEVARRAD